MKKMFALLPALALASCASTAPTGTFAPLDYSYLTPVTFKVANLNVVNNYIPSPAETQLNANNPAPPGPTLLAMLNHRLQPSGAPGTGTVTVQSASINEANGMLNGQLTVDINLISADGHSTGAAEASVSASETEPDADASPDQMQASLYQMTKDLMTAMNVQLPYQIMHSIPSWVAWTSAPGAAAAPAAASAGVQAAPLSAPPSAPFSATGDSGGPATPVNTNPAVPNYLPGAGPAMLAPAP
jgi:hypothetical protein